MGVIWGNPQKNHTIICYKQHATYNTFTNDQIIQLTQPSFSTQHTFDTTRLFHMNRPPAAVSQSSAWPCLLSELWSSNQFSRHPHHQHIYTMSLPSSEIPRVQLRPFFRVQPRPRSEEDSMTQCQQHKSPAGFPRLYPINWRHNHWTIHKLDPIDWIITCINWIITFMNG